MGDAFLTALARLLNAPLTTTASVAEVLWVALSVVGLAVCLVLYREASHNLWATEHLSPSGTRRLIARRDLRTARGRVLMQVLFLVLGLLAAITPPPEHTENERAGLFFALLLIAAQLVMIYRVGRDLLDQYHVRRGGADH